MQVGRIALSGQPLQFCRQSFEVSHHRRAKIHTRFDVLVACRACPRRARQPEALDWSRAIADAAWVLAKRGALPNRTQLGRPGQARLEDPRTVRPRRAAAVAGAVGGQRQRRFRAAAAGPGHPRHPVPRLTPRQNDLLQLLFRKDQMFRCIPPGSGRAQMTRASGTPTPDGELQRQDYKRGLSVAASRRPYAKPRIAFVLGRGHTRSCCRASLARCQ
jgi:hypothetical protein